MPRRLPLLVYGLLVLVPALVLGVTAFRLLGHEQERLRLAATAALEERARTAAENIALAVNDTEDGLMGTLAALPEGELVPALTEWRGKNPLIRDVFVWEATRGFVYPAPPPAAIPVPKGANAKTGGARVPAAKTAAAPSPATAKARSSALLAGRMPWEQTAPADQAKESQKAEEQKADNEAFMYSQAKTAPPPAVQTDSPRQELNAIVLNSVPSQVTANNPQGSNALYNNLGNLRQQGYAMRSNATAAATPPTPAPATASAPAASSAAAAEARHAVDAAPARIQTVEADNRERSQAAAPQARVQAAAIQAQPQAAAATAPAFGWTPLVADRTPVLLGWFQPAPDKPVRGVELAMDALLSRLAAALPADPPRGTAFVLVNGGAGHSLTRPGVSLPGPEFRSLFRMPVGPALPHWDVAVYAAPDADVTAGGRAFLMLSLLLTGTFLAAILAGGAMLVLEAHRSQRDARRKTGFVSNVSHELKTPLTSIRMYAELLGEGRVRDEEKRHRYLDIIITESQRLTRLINNVLDFSRIEQNRKSYNLESVDLAETVRDVLGRLAMRLQEAGMTRIETALPPGELRVRTDRDVVEQVLINLADNAMKYAAAGAELRIEAETGADGRALLRVLDRGPGIPHAEREKVFEKFYRMDHSLTGGKPGCGLGLTISRKMLRDLGGDLACSPRAGGGACFTMVLGAET